MNVYDSDRMADILTPLGFARVDGPDTADMIILNTCHIREKAAEKVFSELGRIRQDRIADGGDRPLVAVAGCVAQAQGEEILRRAPEVDMVFGPQTYHRLPEMLAKAQRQRDVAAGRLRGAGILDTDFPADSKFDALPLPSASQGPAAFLTVQEGCDKFCAFCVVPYTRGAEYSRPVGDVLAEARALAEAGVREITLLGQNVNAYHGADGSGGETGLGGLIRRVAGIDGIERVRYTTSHPRDMDDELIAAHGEVAELMPYLHLPVQSGADTVLETMNRGHTAEFYLRLVERLRAARPDLALSSDFIVGHPGESDADFDATMALVREVDYAQAYSFKYSPRPGTPASTRPQIAEDEKSDRLARLQDLLNRQQLSFNRTFEGQTVDVLFERRGRTDDQAAGRSQHMQAVHITCDSSEEAARLMGRIAEVRVSAAMANSLAGELVVPSLQEAAPA